MMDSGLEHDPSIFHLSVSSLRCGATRTCTGRWTPTRAPTASSTTCYEYDQIPVYELGAFLDAYTASCNPNMLDCGVTGLDAPYNLYPLDEKHLVRAILPLAAQQVLRGEGGVRRDEESQHRLVREPDGCLQLGDMLSS